MLREIIAAFTAFAVTLALVLTGLAGTKGAVGFDGQRAAEETLYRAALCCYALEGAYPESLDHLSSYTDFKPSSKLYAVHYTAIASNLPPEITVLRR